MAYRVFKDMDMIRNSRQEMRRKYPEKKEKIGHFRSIDPCKTETALEDVDIPWGFRFCHQ
jgi:hypothetical protein